MPRPTTISVYERFLGLNSGEATEIGEFQASTLQNFYIANEAQELVRRNGTSPTIDSLGAGNLDMLRWVRINGVEWLMGSYGGHVLNLQGDPPYFVPGCLNRLTSGRDASSAFINNELIIGDGLAQNVRFDGETVAQVMLGQPASGTTLAEFGALFDGLAGTYSYRFAFLSADGRSSQASVATSGVTVVAASGITLTGIPTCSELDCTGVEVYRTINGGTQYYLVATLANGTTTYVDTVLDTAVDTSLVLDEVAVRFPPCQILVNFQERLAGILSDSSEGDNQTLYVSNYQEPEYCPLIAPLDGVDNPVFGARFPLPDAPVGLANLGNVLIVFLRGSAYRLIGQDPNNWDLHKWHDHGTVAHRSIQTYKNMMLWLGPDGVYSMEGSAAGVTTRRISDDITSSLEEITATDMGLAHAFVWDDKYFLCFPSAAFYFDLKYRVWGEHTGWLWRASTVTQNTGSAKERIYAALYGEAQVWQLEIGSTDDEAPILAVWASKDKNLGQYGRDKRVHRVLATFKTGTGEASGLLYRGAGELIQVIEQDLSSVKRTGSAISIMDKRAVSAARDEYFRLEIRTATEDDVFRILQAGFTWSLAT